MMYEESFCRPLATASIWLLCAANASSDETVDAIDATRELARDVIVCTAIFGGIKLVMMIYERCL